MLSRFILRPIGALLRLIRRVFVIGVLAAAATAMGAAAAYVHGVTVWAPVGLHQIDALALAGRERDDAAAPPRALVWLGASREGETSMFHLAAQSWPVGALGGGEARLHDEIVTALRPEAGCEVVHTLRAAAVEDLLEAAPEIITADAGAAAAAISVLGDAAHQSLPPSLASKLPPQLARKTPAELAAMPRAALMASLPPAMATRLRGMSEAALAEMAAEAMAEAGASPIPAPSAAPAASAQSAEAQRAAAPAPSPGAIAKAAAAAIGAKPVEISYCGVNRIEAASFAGESGSIAMDAAFHESLTERTMTAPTALRFAVRQEGDRIAVQGSEAQMDGLPEALISRLARSAGYETTRACLGHIDLAGSRLRFAPEEATDLTATIAVGGGFGGVEALGRCILKHYAKLG
ncbi:MAG: hypothetical protein AAGM38_07935 [Pseudomonadota bacterium]